jgi:hypothetical protein
MKTRSAKQKGKRLTTAVRNVILERFPQLVDDDVTVVVRSQPGTDIKLSPNARRVFPYSVECKNVERLNIWSALSQAQANTQQGTTPLLVFSRNRTEPYVAMKLTEFMKLRATTGV